jgi:hypothetical protein
MFGIVLAKMLLFGADVDELELYDYHTDGIIENLTCSRPDYLELLKLW